MRDNGLQGRQGGDGGLRRRLAALVEALPPHGAVTLTREDLVEWLDAEDGLQPEPAETEAPLPWRAKIWDERLLPDATLLSALETSESIGRSRDWVYRAVKDGRLVASRIDDAIAIRAGDLRNYMQRTRGAKPRVRDTRSGNRAHRREKRGAP